jgi:hypothetical protein
MNRRFHMLLIITILGLAASAASAQISAPVYVPFNFIANHQLLPAGTYKVELLSDRFVAFINNETGKTERIVMVRPETGSRIESVGGLVFLSYVGRSPDDRYVLKEVRMTGSSMHSELAIQPKPEPLSAKNASVSTFEIAMR